MHLIGIDGGGTKTIAALSNEKGEVLRVKRGGPSNLRNVGIDVAAKNIFQLIENITDDGSKVALSYISVASFDEEFAEKKEELFSRLKAMGLKGEIVIAGDQLAAFRSGTKEKDGVVVICGTGAVIRGWKEESEKKVSGWGFFADEGSAFYIGIEGYRAVLKSFDGRAEETKIMDVIYKNWKVRDGNGINKKVYSDFFKNIPLISIMVSEAADSGDKVAKKILQEAAEEVLSSLKVVVEGLGIKDNFPLVLTGGVFQSSIFFSFLKEKISETYPGARIIFSDNNTAKGAVDLAVEHYKNR